MRHWPDLLVNLVDPDGVDLWVEVVEGEVLEAEEETVELADALLHDGQGRIKPAHVHAGPLHKALQRKDQDLQWKSMTIAEFSDPMLQYSGA